MDAQDFDGFLDAISEAPLQVIDSAILINDYVSIDLSSSNASLKQIDVSSSKAWELYLEHYLKERNSKAAFGGYLEKRDIYSRSTYFKQSTSENERNIHLGVDVWCSVNTQVLAVLDGEIHSLQNNTNFGDYGPTIILKHNINTTEFYSLYGHLNLESIATAKVGDKVKQGMTIGHLGDSAINGDYAPHLHFQLIKDMEGKFGDYPGVSSDKNLEFYKHNCPDPNLLLKLR